MSTERTPLTSSQPLPGPAYVFPGVSPRTRRRQVRQFQCCICSLFMAVVGLALVITISYTINEGDETTNLTSNSLLVDNVTLNPNELDPGPMNASEIFLFLLTMDQPVIDEDPANWSLPNPILNADKTEAEDEGKKALGDREIMEENLNSPAVNTPSFRHQRAIGSTAEARKLTKRGYAEIHATLHIAMKLNYTKPARRSNIGRGPKMGSPNPRENITCDFNAKYRTSNGTCNNRKYPTQYGVALRPFRRSLEPDYGDGISSPRESHYGGKLPSARQVSTQIHRPSYSTDPNFTVMLAVWGQFLDHDMTATAANQGSDGEPIECCVPSDEKPHPECFPVPLGPGDPYYDEYNVTCMNFIRSAPAPTGRFGPRQQMNQASAFIDGSSVYGVTEEKQKSLRLMDGGQLRMFNTLDNRTLLPISTDPNDGCNEVKMNAQGKYCFQSGDLRANENLHLTSMHLLWARHHNYLAQSLQRTNPDWDDETLFQEARKVLAAQIQHITYNEFIPMLLGRKFTEVKDLTPNASRNSDTYDESVDPSIANNFAGAAFRFAHTLIPGLMKMFRANNDTPEAIQLHKMLFNPYSLWTEKGVDNALGSAVNTPLAKSDQFFTTELTEKLFEGSPVENKTKTPFCGLDLVSLNIQRGRDHGLPSYSEWRRHCRLPAVDTWERLARAVDASSYENMRRIYGNPNDVDIYSGALSEPPMENAIFGPLLACLVSDQFIRLKRGDSFWYERKRGPQRFTKDQLNEIYKTTLAGVICRNADAVTQTQKFVMKRVDNETNPVVNCTELDRINFEAWSNKIPNKDTAKIRGGTGQSLIAVVPNTNNTSPVNKLPE